jgi:hypothetical protein
MTKKDYEMIAKVIKDNTVWIKKQDNYGEYITERKIHPNDLMARLSLAFEKDNPNFDKYKFWDACTKPYPEDWQKPEQTIEEE